ncbi:hypothetical protein HOD05_03500 [Candidatus Woesearchaeota archaeon]|jgi:hypothetical protein|nr:hypothetical protein [Candidatus Woesearchaeota archaeon]MBT4150618.1 hypothetical protein [Candidatus Woesearchaeota archaeon]MBT4247836.1 hypothetical protein [Candidatus Woesearchaeota archaeon]MBT4434260.1 hypothetical protein [Candidatus Woesearchaeota archaeon]MBT7331819.1 hypothetical protein [Candidatus Woesearchaeota archaeon]
MTEYVPSFIHKNKIYSRIAYDVLRIETMSPITYAYFLGQDVRSKFSETRQNNNLDDCFLNLTQESLVTSGYRSEFPISATLDTVVGNTIGLIGTPFAFVIGFFSNNK